MVDKKVIPVVFATDENYVPYCGVAIQSLIDHTSDVNDYYIYILYDKLSEQAKYRLGLFDEENIHIIFKSIHEEISKINIYEQRHLSIATAYRLMIPKLFPEYNKIIYLDSDIVVLDDIAKLYELEIGEKYLGAANGFFDSDFFKDYTKNVLRINHSNFFNAGILLMNTKMLREEQVGERCLDLLASRDDLIYMDQCALNILCEGKVQFIPREWNYEWNYLFDSTIDKGKYYCHKPFLIHFDGIRKPWEYITQIYAEEFWKYARKTVFYEEIVKKGNNTRINEIFSFLNNNISVHKVAVYGAGAKGKMLVEKLINLDVIQIAVWVDKNYQNIQSDIMTVYDVDRLMYTTYDKVWVAIENNDIYMDVKTMLCKKGIPEDKICQMII